MICTPVRRVKQNIYIYIYLSMIFSAGDKLWSNGATRNCQLWLIDFNISSVSWTFRRPGVVCATRCIVHTSTVPIFRREYCSAAVVLQRLFWNDVSELATLTKTYVENCTRDCRGPAKRKTTLTLSIAVAESSSGRRCKKERVFANTKSIHTYTWAGR